VLRDRREPIGDRKRVFWSVLFVSVPASTWKYFDMPDGEKIVPSALIDSCATSTTTAGASRSDRRTGLRDEIVGAMPAIDSCVCRVHLLRELDVLGDGRRRDRRRCARCSPALWLRDQRRRPDPSP
jgi:hypothetical protein